VYSATARQISEVGWLEVAVHDGVPEIAPLRGQDGSRRLSVYDLVQRSRSIADGVGGEVAVQ
jgi:hypothetical protein